MGVQPPLEDGLPTVNTVTEDRFFTVVSFLKPRSVAQKQKLIRDVDTSRGRFTDRKYCNRGQIFYRGQFFKTKVGCTETKTDPPSADTLTIDCRWNIGRLSVLYRSTLV